MTVSLRPSIAPNIVSFDRTECLRATGKQAADEIIISWLRKPRLSSYARSTACALPALSIRAATAARKPSPAGECAKTKGQILRHVGGRFAGGHYL